MLNWHLLTDCTQNNLSRSPAKLCQTTFDSTAAVWNQLRCPSDSLQSSCCKRYSLTSYGLGMKSVCRRTTIQLAERSGLCANWQQEAIHRSQPYATNVGYDVCGRVTSGYDWTGICQPWGEGERPVLLQCLAVSADVSGNQTCRRTLFIHKTICCLRRNWSFLCSVISQGKVVALDRWGGKWNHLSMTKRLTTNYAKNYCNRTLIDVVTCFFGTQCR